MIYVFDLDGTLIDSKVRHYALMERLFKKNGILPTEFFPADYMQYKSEGNSGLNYLMNVMRLPKEIAQELNIQWINSIEKEELLCLDVLYGDSIETCNKCIENNIQIIIFTSRHNSIGTKRQLVNLGLEKYAYKTKIVDSYYQNKVDEIRTINQTEKIDLIIGDTEVDYCAAKTINCPFYMLNRGFRSKKYWDKMMVTSFEDLSKLPMEGLL